MENNSHLCFVGVKLKFVELSVILASAPTHHPPLAPPAKHTPPFVVSPQEMVIPAPIACQILGHNSNANLLLYIRRRYHVLLSLPRISISRIPSLLSLPLALLYPRPLPDLARLRENLCRISITTALNRSFPPPPQTLSSTKLMYRRVPAYTTFTFTPGLVNSASFVWTLLPNLFLATSCLLFFLQG